MSLRVSRAPAFKCATGDFSSTLSYFIEFPSSFLWRKRPKARLEFLPHHCCLSFLCGRFDLLSPFWIFDAARPDVRNLPVSDVLKTLVELESRMIFPRTGVQVFSSDLRVFRTSSQPHATILSPRGRFPPSFSLQYPWMHFGGSEVLFYLFPNILP